MKIVYAARHGCGGQQDEDAISHALRELGHEVVTVTEAQPRMCVRKLAGADLLLFHKWDEAEAVPVLKAAAGRVARAFWYFDLVDWPGDPVIAGRCARRRRWMDAVSPHVEFAFCTDGDWAAYSASVQAPGTGPKWVWLPQGADGRVVGRGPAGHKKGVAPKLLYTGVDAAGGVGRGRWVAEVRARLGDSLLHVRSGVYREELRTLVANTAAVLCPDSPVSASYWSNRVYVAAGFGACVLHPWVANLSDQYADGDEVVYYRSVDQMCETAAELLKDRAARAVIGDAALERTKRCHLYRHRCERLLKVVAAGRTAPAEAP